MYQTPPPTTSNAAAARPRNNPFFKLPAVAASNADSEDSSNIDPPKAASSELTSGSRPGKGSDAGGATEEKEMGAPSAGTVAEVLGGGGSGLGNVRERRKPTRDPVLFHGNRSRCGCWRRFRIARKRRKPVWN